ncbi:MAG: hypothetical protein WCS09_02745 [Pseudomonadota bacterium]|jgi:hypothetical protein
MTELLVLCCAAAIVLICTCRVDLGHGRAFGALTMLAYVPLAMWALARALEVMSGETHTWTDLGGLLAVAVHLLCMARRWHGVERRRSAA